MRAAASNWGLELERGPACLLVTVKRPDADGSDESSSLAERLWLLLQRHLTYRLVLELDDIDFVDRSFFADLISLKRRISEHQGMLRLCGLPPCIRGALLLSGLGDRLPVYDSREEAVFGWRRPHQPR